MKRRSFCRYLALSSACSSGVFGRNSATGTMIPKSSKAKSHHNWVVIYWMPYDNDLVIYGESIVEMLTRGTKYSETAVVVQSDYLGDKKMRRRKLVKGIAHEIDVVLGEDSSDVSAFSAYLDWANQTFKAENWVVIVVGHGGKINEFSPDDHKSTDQTRTWMRVDQFANALSNFNQNVNGRIELLFFQNCNKATLEVIYEARKCARYTLASQLNVGAPNYYYEGFLQRIKESSICGREAALAIMESESTSMYHTFTLVDNKYVGLIPEKLSGLVKSIASNGLLVVDKSQLYTYHYCGEQHCDVLALFRFLSRNSKKTKNELARFVDFIRSSVITYYKTEGQLYRSVFTKNGNLQELCGLSMYLPETEKTISRYNTLALHQKVDLLSLYKGILIN